MFSRRARCWDPVGFSDSGTFGRSLASNTSPFTYFGSEPSLASRSRASAVSGTSLSPSGVRVLLADEPSLGVPRSTLALAGQPLDVPRVADVLGAERHELLRPHDDEVELALARRPGLLPPAALGLAA